VLDNLNFFALFSLLPLATERTLHRPPHTFFFLSALPLKLRINPAYRVVAVSAGGHHSLVLTEEGRVQSPHIPPFFFIFFLLTPCFWHHAWPQVFSFGNGLHGRLGHGNEETCFEPRRIAFFDTTARVAKISAGTTHSLALTKDGKAYSFGFGMFGRLGHGDETDQLLPREITLRGHGASPPVGDRVEENETDPAIEHIAAGYFHSLLLTTDGTTSTLMPRP
jgi:alpha-tubulin suppressor-like RCC1 family protein